MAHNKNKIPRLVVSKGAFSRFLEKNYGYTDLRQYVTSGKFSSRLNSVFLAKNAEGNEVFVKACRYGDLSENEYRCTLALWEQAPLHFAKPLAYYSGKRYSFCSFEYVPGEDLRTIVQRKDALTGEQRARIVEDIYMIFQALKRADIVHRDVALKNMIYHEGRVILIDCQLATRRTAKEQISFFDNILKLCMWKWESEPGMLVLEWSDVMTLMRTLRFIGADVSYQKRYEAVYAEMKSELHTFKYVHPYPSQKELNHCMKVCKLRSLFHPKAKLRARYRHVLEMLRFFKLHHPEQKVSVD
ncbi:MAG: protein kinase [Akkermansia sp.]|nr:protein kinase [Akkermansia sp.]